MDFKRKIGPLPAYAWALILGGSLGAYLLVKKGKASTGTTGEVVPELAGQALPGSEAAGGGGAGAAGSLEAAEAKDSSAIEALQQQIASEHTNTAPGGLGAGIGEVIQAREALEALGLQVGSPQHNTEPASAAHSAVKAATGKGPGFPLTSSRGKYRTTMFKGHTAHEYASAVTGGVGPRRNLIVLGGPAKAGHAQRGSHAPAHVSKPPAHHTAAKPRTRPAEHAAPAAHRAPARPAPKPAPRPKPARRPAPAKRRRP